MTASTTIRLSQARLGDRGVLVQVGEARHHGEHETELERRLLEFGFVEGARIELLHEGVIGGDPIAIRVDDMRVALRRREASHMMIQLDGAAA